MNRLQRSAIALAIGAASALGSGCAVTGDGYAYGRGYASPYGNGYGYDNSLQLGLGYYEPYGGVYGDWGPGYRVGPYRDGGYRRDRGGGGHGQPPHGYRPAPPSRGVPSIPSRSRAAGVRPH